MRECMRCTGYYFKWMRGCKIFKTTTTTISSPLFLIKVMQAKIGLLWTAGVETGGNRFFIFRFKWKYCWHAAGSQNEMSSLSPQECVWKIVSQILLCSCMRYDRWICVRYFMHPWLILFSSNIFIVDMDYSTLFHQNRKIFSVKPAHKN